MSVNKLHELEEMAAAFGVAESSQASATEDAGVDSGSATIEEAATPAAGVEPLVGLDLDTAIRLRWALRDIKGNRTKLTPVSPDDLRALVEMGLVEMRDDVPVLTNEGHRVLD